MNGNGNGDTPNEAGEASREARSAEGSDLSDLRAESRAKALGSFSFYARHVLGLRALRASRLSEIQDGSPTRSALERFAFDGWLGLQNSEVRTGPLWLLKESHEVQEEGSE